MFSGGVASDTSFLCCWQSASNVTNPCNKITSIRPAGEKEKKIGKINSFFSDFWFLFANFSLGVNNLPRMQRTARKLSRGTMNRRVHQICVVLCLWDQPETAKFISVAEYSTTNWTLMVIVMGPLTAFTSHSVVISSMVGMTRLSFRLHVFRYLFTITRMMCWSILF